jgi:hypothetical protein
MNYHKYRFGLKENIKVLLCKIFGHRLNENPTHFWCERCGLSYESCYHPRKYFEELAEWINKPRDD